MQRKPIETSVPSVPLFEVCLNLQKVRLRGQKGTIFKKEELNFICFLCNLDLRNQKYFFKFLFIRMFYKKIWGIFLLLMV